MSLFNRDLKQEKWESMPFFDQIANVGIDVGRAIQWREKDSQKSDLSFDRALELLDMTIDDKKNQQHSKELHRLREVLADYFCGNNIYSSNPEQWNDYFYGFQYASAVNRECSNL